MSAALLLAAALVLPAPAATPVDRFEAPDALARWDRILFEKVPRATEYALESGCAAARSSASASGLLKRVSVDLSQEPVLRWRWRVEAALTAGDPRRKGGDDYAARVYVAFRYDPSRASAWQRAKYRAAKLLWGEFPPHAVINYVWDGRSDAGEAYDNPYSDRVKMVVARGRETPGGAWREEARDVAADFRRFFGGEPPPLEFVAIMTDTDDTKSAASACYDDLEFTAK